MEEVSVITMILNDNNEGLGHVLIVYLSVRCVLNAHLIAFSGLKTMSYNNAEIGTMISTLVPKLNNYKDLLYSYMLLVLQLTLSQTAITYL